MPSWAAANTEVIALVRGLLPRNPSVFDGTTIPTLTQVDQWLDEAEDEIEGVLAAEGITVPATAAALNILGKYSAEYAAGQIKNLIDTAGGGSGDAGAPNLECYEQMLVSLQVRPDYWKKKLGVSLGGATFARGNVLNNRDGLTIEDGDFEAKIKITEKF